MKKDFKIQPFKYVDAVILPGKLAVPVEKVQINKEIQGAIHKK